MRYEDYLLSEREFDVFVRTLEGKSNEEIANELFIASTTVRFHLTSIYKAVGLSSKSGKHTGKALVAMFAGKSLVHFAPPGKRDEQMKREGLTEPPPLPPRKEDIKLADIDKRLTKVEDVVLRRIVQND